MKRSKWGGAFACGALIAIALDSAGGCGSTPPSHPFAFEYDASSGPAVAYGVVVCGTFDALDRTGQKYSQPEWYSLTAINNKIRHFPAMAEELGVQPNVSSCASARAFAAGYDKYLTAHPHFDAREPIEFPYLPPASPPPGPPPDIPKVLNGTPLGEDPVVNIQNVGNASGLTLMTGGCTGTFIAKNWIATAEHCMQIAAPGDGFFPMLPTGGTNGDLTNLVGTPLPDADVDVSDAALADAGLDCTALASAGIDCRSLPFLVFVRMFGWYQFAITWADANGNQVTKATQIQGDPNLKLPLTAWGKQYPDPRYIGISSTQSMNLRGDFDFALIYLYADYYDPILPPDPSKGSAMRVSLIPPTSGAFDLTFGFGSVGTNGSPATLQAIEPQVDTVNNYSYTVTPLTTDSGPALCFGDSGGPMVRFGSLNGNFVPIIDGIASNISNPSSAGCGLSGDIDAYALMSEEAASTQTSLSWVEIAMQSFNGPSFHCRPFASVANGPKDAAECWGEPCKANSDCPSNKICSLYSPIGKANPGCSTCSDGTCNCLVGQCLAE